MAIHDKTEAQRRRHEVLAALRDCLGREPARARFGRSITPVLSAFADDPAPTLRHLSAIEHYVGSEEAAARLTVPAVLHRLLPLFETPLVDPSLEWDAQHQALRYRIEAVAAAVAGDGARVGRREALPTAVLLSAASGGRLPVVESPADLTRLAALDEGHRVELLRRHDLSGWPDAARFARDVLAQAMLLARVAEPGGMDAAELERALYALASCSAVRAGAALRWVCPGARDEPPCTGAARIEACLAARGPHPALRPAELLRELLEWMEPGRGYPPLSRREVVAALVPEAALVRRVLWEERARTEVGEKGWVQYERDARDDHDDRFRIVGPASAHFGLRLFPRDRERIRKMLAPTGGLFEPERVVLDVATLSFFRGVRGVGGRSGEVPAFVLHLKSRPPGTGKGRTVRAICEALERKHALTTYGAIAKVTGGTARGVMSSYPREEPYWRVVSVRTGLPTGYEDVPLPAEIDDPEKRRALPLLRSGAELERWLRHNAPELFDEPAASGGGRGASEPEGSSVVVGHVLGSFVSGEPPDQTVFRQELDALVSILPEHDVWLAPSRSPATLLVTVRVAAGETWIVEGRPVLALEDGGGGQEAVVAKFYRRRPEGVVESVQHGAAQAVIEALEGADLPAGELARLLETDPSAIHRRLSYQRSRR